MSAEEHFWDAVRDDSMPERGTEEFDQLSDRMSEAGKEHNRGWAERPDPSEPWRYACPDCGDFKIEVRLGKEKLRGKDYSFRDWKTKQREATNRYSCTDCGERKPHVIDRKTGERARP